MARPMQPKWEVFLVLASAIPFALAGLWPAFTGEPFLFPGLAKFAAADDFNRVSQMLAVSCAAAWFVVFPEQTRDRLLVFEGAALALFVVGFLHPGGPFGIAFAVFGSIARRRADRLKSGTETEKA